MTEAHPNLPMPLFKIGDVVFVPSTETTVAKYPCPDCRGTGKWKVITATQEMECQCQRCGSHTYNDVPSLAYRIHEPRVTRLTIGSIEVKTSPWPADYDPISYMCNETGISSGSVYQERTLYMREIDADAAAKLMAEQRNRDIQAEPEEMRKRTISYLTFVGALVELSKSAVWNSWWCYRHLLEDVKSHLEELPEDAKRDIKWTLDYEERNREPPEIEKLLMLADAGDVAGLLEWRKRFPALFAISEAEKIP